jgi:Ni,Fe-hydrogenase maturation factor
MLYDRQPRGILFSIRGHDFNFGTEFSPETAAAATETVERIARLIHDLQSCEVACA